MGVVVDLDRREIRASIRDLAGLRRDGPRGAGLLGRARAELGTRVHQEYREEREGNVEGFRAEVEVGLERRVDGFSARVRGRVDGLIDTGRGLVVEEVKSVLMGGAELVRARAEFFGDWALQARLYCLALAEQYPERSISARLILVSLLDGTRTELPVELHPGSTRARLDDLLRDAVRQAEADRDRARRLAEVAEKLRFPYERMWPHQGELVETMGHGLAAGRPVLAMAPTGIGKTVAALLAGLGYALRSDTHMVFLTAKTTQQKLVERTFEDLCRASDLEPGDIRSLTLKAKQKMCPPGHVLCHPQVCPLLEDFQVRLARSQAVGQLLAAGFRIDPDAVLAAGEASRLCPFYLSLALVPRVELLIGDYNYLYDPSVALAELAGEDVAGPVVVIDEAHNLFDRARGYYSPFVSKAELAGLSAAIEAGEYLAGTERTDQLRLAGTQAAVDGPALFEDVRGLITDLDAAMDGALAAAESSGVAMVEDCRPARSDLGVFEDLGDRAAGLLVPYVLYNRIHGLVRPQDPLVDLLGRLGRLRDVLRLQAREFVPYAAGQGAPGGSGFGCLCVNPAARLAESHRRATGTLAMSATLTPLSYYADVLGFAGLDPVQVSMPSPFPRENLGVWTAASVSTTFRERDRHRADIARIIRRTISARPGRYVAFFPSFRFLERVHGELGLPAGQVLIQLPGLTDSGRQSLLDRFRRSRGPALLLAVMGGIFAEGVDLPGAELIGAVVVGPGLPQVGFERAAMQQYFHEEYEQGFAYAMLYPGMQRVIQSAGRVIRGPDDQGVIVLVGRRFAEPELAACLPEHWYRYSPAELVTDDLRSDLTAFWKSAGRAGGTSG